MQLIRVSSDKATRWLFIVLGVILALHLFVVFGHVVLHMRLKALTMLVDLDLESNLPALYNVLLFIMGAALFLLHAKVADAKTCSGWYLMAGVFLFLGIDEGSQIHEKFKLITGRLIAHGGPVDQAWLYYAWVLPYLLAAGILGVLLSRWFLRLPPALRKGLLISGCVYLFGAVLMEMAAGKLLQSLPPQDPAMFPWMPRGVYPGQGTSWMYMDPRYITLYTLEEVGEMTGLILCIRYLLKAFEARQLKVQLMVVPEE